MEDQLPFYKLEQYIPQAAGAVLIESGSFQNVYSSSIDNEEIQTPCAFIRYDGSERMEETIRNVPTWKMQLSIMILTNRATNSEDNHYDYVAKTRYLLETNWKMNEKLTYHLVNNVGEVSSRRSLMEEENLDGTEMTFEMDVSAEPSLWLATSA